MRRHAAAMLLVPAVFASSARAGDDVDIVRYEIESLLGSSAELRAIVHVEFAGGGDIELELSPQMAVKKAELGAAPLTYVREGNRLTVETGKGVAAERRRMRISVCGKPHVEFAQARGGFARTQVSPEIAYVRSQYAWYPRIPDDRAQYAVRVALFDTTRDWRAHTCGTLRGVERTHAATTWTFETEREVARAGLVAGPYREIERESDGGLVAKALVLTGDEAAAAHLLGVAAHALEHYRARFGETALPGYTLVEMPDAFGAGSGYGEAGYALIGAGAFRAAGAAPWADELVMHEVAHLWFGAEVGFSDWISESLASWATLGCIEAASGADAGRRARQASIQAFLAVADQGRGISASELHGFGGAADPQIYRVHAYDEGAAMLWMIGDHVGRDGLDERVRAFLDAARGETRGRGDVFEALRRLGKDAAALVDLWAGAEVLVLSVEHAYSGGRVKGTIRLSGAPAVPIEVDVLALCDGEEVTARIACKKAATRFSFAAPSALGHVLVDPGYRVVASRPEPAGDPGEVVKRVIGGVVNSGVRDPQRLEEAVRELRLLLRLGTAGKLEGVVHTGIGRCLFRLGRHDEAAAALETALELGAGGPFHRRWCHLRLGCIADLAKRRDEAVAHYRKAAQGKDTRMAAQMARRFLERKYRGIEKDG